MRGIDKWVLAAATTFSLGGLVMAAPGLGDAIKALTAEAGRGVVWDQKTAIKADVVCSGNPSTIMVGHRRNNVLIGIVPDAHSKPIVFEFRGDNSVGQDAFCEPKVRLVPEPRDCIGAGDVRIEGCKVVKGCSAFGAYDDVCDAFHFYWDNRKKQLAYWRL